MVASLSSDTPELGFLLDTHRKKYRFHIIGGLVFTALGLLSAFIGALLADDWIALSLAGVIVFAFGLLTTFQGIHHRRISVDLYTNGFVYKKCGKSIAIPWQAIADVKILIDRRPGKPTYTYTILTTSKQRIILDSTIERFEDLGESIMHGFSRLRGDIWDKRMLEEA